MSEFCGGTMTVGVREVELWYCGFGVVEGYSVDET